MIHLEQFAKPEASHDFASSFFRNKRQFLSPGLRGARSVIDVSVDIPSSYSFAERIDPSKGGIPCASYFELSPETEGLPISRRVRAGLRDLYERSKAQGHRGLDVHFAASQLHQAHESETEDNWTAAIQHAAEAYETGGPDHKKDALAVLGRVLDTVSHYRNFAPASERKTIITPMGDRTVPACLSDEDVAYYERVARWGTK